MEYGSIEREIHVEASPEVVFEVISSPEHLREWWPDEADLEPVPGGTGELVFGDRADRRRAHRRDHRRRRRPAPTASRSAGSTPTGEVRGSRQLAAGHLRARAVRRRHRGAADRDRVPRDGLGGRGPRGALQRPRHRLGLLRRPGWARTWPGWSSAPMTVAVDDDLWSAIGDPTRRRMLDLLLADGDGTATTLSEQLPVTRQAVAKHLGVLDRVGLVHVTPAGREMRYQVDEAQLARAVAQLTAVGATWDAPAAAHQADRRGDPAPAGRVTPTAHTRKRYGHGRHPASRRGRARRPSTTCTTHSPRSTACPAGGRATPRGGTGVGGVLQFRFAPAASTWRSSSSSRRSACSGRSPTVPTSGSARPSASTSTDGDYTTVVFKHRAGAEPVEFMHHCSTKWGVFLMSLKSLLETGTGAPEPRDVKIDSWN